MANPDNFALWNSRLVFQPHRDRIDCATLIVQVTIAYLHVLTRRVLVFRLPALCCSNVPRHQTAHGYPYSLAKA